MSANCPSLAIANWPISAWIARTFGAFKPPPITADLFLNRQTDNAPPRRGRCRIRDQTGAAFHCARKRATSVTMTGTRATSETVHIVGAGLAGSEVAWQVANSGIPVILHEKRPWRMTEAHRTDGHAELVCSNSYPPPDAPNHARGLLPHAT